MSIRRTDAMDVLDACSLKEWDTSYVGFIVDGAKWLVDNTDIKLVGIDYLSVASYDYLIPSHLVFLKDREIILVEGLMLDDVPAIVVNSGRSGRYSGGAERSVPHP
ncbi:Cyclase-like protein 2 [Glycine max]|nr:Cyclase-like protein 2 [Glycine max]